MRTVSNNHPTTTGVYLAVSRRVQIPQRQMLVLLSGPFQVKAGGGAHDHLLQLEGPFEEVQYSRDFSIWSAPAALCLGRHRRAPTDVSLLPWSSGSTELRIAPTECGVHRWGPRRRRAYVDVAHQVIDSLQRDPTRLDRRRAHRPSLVRNRPYEQAVVSVAPESPRRVTPVGLRSHT